MQTLHQYWRTIDLHTLDEIDQTIAARGIQSALEERAVTVRGAYEILLSILLEDVAAPLGRYRRRDRFVAAGDERRRAANAHIEDHSALDLVRENPVPAVVADVELEEVVVGVAAGAESEVRGGDVPRVGRVVDVVDRELVAPVEDDEVVPLPTQVLDAHRSLAPGRVDAVVAGVEQGVDPTRAVALRCGGNCRGHYEQRDHAEQRGARKSLKRRNP